MVVGVYGPVVKPVGFGGSRRSLRPHNMPDVRIAHLLSVITAAV